jgi:hypothetical protein
MLRDNPITPRQTAARARQPRSALMLATASGQCSDVRALRALETGDRLLMFKPFTLALAASLFTLAGCAADTSPEDPASTEAPAPIGSDQVDPAYAISCPPPVYQCIATKASYTTFAACASACNATTYPGICQTVYPYCYGVPPRAPK